MLENNAEKHYWYSGGGFFIRKIMSVSKSFQNIFCIVLIVFLSFFSPAWSQSVSAKNSYKVARAHAERGNWTGALVEVQRALSEDSNYLDAIFLRGLCSLVLDDEEQAEKDMQTVVQRAPDFFPAYNNLAALYTAQDRYEEAKTVLRTMMNVPGGKATAYFSLGVLAYHAQDLQEAESNWKQAVHEDLLMASPHYNLGLLYRLQERKDLALSELTKSVELNPGHPLYRTMLAWQLYDRGSIEEAKIELRTVPNFAQERPAVMILSRGLLAFFEGDFSQSKTLAQSALEQEPELIQAKILKAMASESLKETTEAQALYAEIYEQDPNLTWAKQKADQQAVPVRP